MNILIFKTDIKTKRKVNVLKNILRKYPVIIDWSVDVEDVDRVLRVKTIGNINENEIINLIKPSGFNCEVLQD